MAIAAVNREVNCGASIMVLHFVNIAVFYKLCGFDPLTRCATIP